MCIDYNDFYRYDFPEVNLENEGERHEQKKTWYDRSYGKRNWIWWRMAGETS